MTEENNTPAPPATTASAPEQAATGDTCTPNADVLRTQRMSGKDSYIITAKGSNGENVSAFVEGSFSQKNGQTVLSEDARVMLMGSVNGKRFEHNRTSDGNKVREVLTREEMMDPSRDDFSRNPQLAAKIRAAATELYACSNVGPAVEILSSDPRAPIGTPAAPGNNQRQK